jgi:hypothetical protein
MGPPVGQTEPRSRSSRGTTEELGELSSSAAPDSGAEWRAAKMDFLSGL